MTGFCGAADPTPRIAALGIVSAYDRPKFRFQARASWMAGAARRARELAGGMACRFVMRGQNASAGLLSEAATEGDVLLVKAPTLNRLSGPLISLQLWLDCALEAWPNAAMIGKADDDVWVHVPGVELHLQLTLAAVRNQSQVTRPLVYWGVHETYHWSKQTNLPEGFAYLWGWNAKDEERDCARAQRIGPYFFAKGPLFFVSTPIVRQISRSSEVRSLAAAAVSAASVARPRREELVPYEDVFAGLAIAIAAHGAREMYAVHAGDIGDTTHGVFVEPDSARIRGDYLALAPSTLFYHEKYKHHERISTAHAWAARRHCDPRRVELRCLEKRYVGCGGARWTRCTTTARPYFEAGCDTTLARLSGGFSADEQQASAAQAPACDAATPPPAHLAPHVHRGSCAVTEFGASDCDAGTQGAWVLRGGSLGECARLCGCCARCHFVSYSKAESDCSWFAECDTTALLSKGPAGNFRTVRVRG